MKLQDKLETIIDNHNNHHEGYRTRLIANDIINVLRNLDADGELKSKVWNEGNTPEQFTWTVKQWKLTEAERAEVNEKDWHVQNEYCDVKNKPTVENVQWGIDNNKYKETANALAYNLEEVFQMGNYFDASDNFSHTKDFYSISIGDIIINNQTADAFFVADWGFEKLS